MELARRKKYKVVTVAGDLRDFGKMVADGLRSSVDIAGRAINVIATRGGADEVVTVAEDSRDVNPMVWYALGAAGILAVAAVAKRKRR